MSVVYDSVHWTPYKKQYDRIMLVLMAAFLVVFSGAQMLVHPNSTIETLIIRATGALAFFMLHVVLVIGPLCRLDRRFLPLLYNRRHLGVATFLISAVHGVFNLIQFHTLGNVGPIQSLLSSALLLGTTGEVPFQLFGFLALIILLLMAATSHDIWLNLLSPRIWKAFHMSVYLAYGLLVAHVLFGVVQLDKSSLSFIMIAVGMTIVTCLHVAAGWKQGQLDRMAKRVESDLAHEGFVFACLQSEIAENRAKMLVIGSENIALFKHEGNFSAVHNLCKHQNGPLSEGKIIDGCITCPWHGYQYLPGTGAAPPPFSEKVDTYAVRVVGEKVFVHPKPL
jgi:methionine sulfoxide reductase heme-binding subunit